MSELLSQDQLDALLGQDSDAMSAQAIGGDEGVDEGPKKDYDALASAVNFFNEKAGAVIQNVLNRKVSLAVTECTAIDAVKMKGAIQSPAVMVSVTFEGAMEGTLCLVMATKTAAMLADLMLMGDGKAEYNDDHKDALGELCNQIIGAYTTAVAEKAGGPVTGGNIAVQDFDIGQPPIPLQNCEMALITLKIEGQEDAAIGMIVPDILSGTLMSKFGEAGGGDATAGGEEKGVGLSGAELDDLSKVASDFGEGGHEAFKGQIGEGGVTAGNKSVEMLLDIDLDVSIELGRANLSIKRILELSPGSIVELDRMAGEPVDLLVNDKVVAKGEVVVVDENFGIRIVSLVSPEERIKSLR